MHNGATLVGNRFLRLLRRGNKDACGAQCLLLRGGSIRTCDQRLRTVCFIQMHGDAAADWAVSGVALIRCLRRNAHGKMAAANMASWWTSLVIRFVPMRWLPRRYSTEMVVRGLYEKYNGQDLDAAFFRQRMGEREIQVLFDAVDRQYGAAIFSGDDAEMDLALTAACAVIAAALRERQERHNE